MEKIPVFLDTDVVIAALLSKTGASSALIEAPQIIKIVSKAVKQEIKEVTKRLNIDRQEITRILKNIRVVSLNLSQKEVLKKYQEFVFDKKDSHVVAGAHQVKSKFLLTHNLKHYQIDKSKAELGIIILKPGNFLQYLRSLAKF